MVTRATGGEQKGVSASGASRPRRSDRDRGAGGGAQSGAGGGKGGAGRPRSRRRGPPLALTPEALIAQAAQAESASETSKAPEEPLTSEELALMQQHFRFLRDYRKVLHLRVNAQEDLLLNEKRQPTRRGVCQHLLAKVDRARVFSAAERLEPAAATRFAEGILRISPDLDYLILYLQCVGRSASQQQAVSALAHALSAIDFGQLSRGQMRRVLDLIVELFDDRQRPQVLLGLLDNPGFRRAFDDALEEFPEALAAQVAPLRAVQLVVFRGERNTLGADGLERGLGLLMVRGGTLARRCPLAAKWRLAERAIESGVALGEESRDELWSLIDSLKDDNRERHAVAVMAWAKRLVAHGEEAYARRLLSGLAKSSPAQEACKRWLNALDAPRWGRIAILGTATTVGGGGRSRVVPRAHQNRGAAQSELPRSDAADPQWRAGVLLDTMRSVHVIQGAGAADELDATDPVGVPNVPGLAPIWMRGVAPDGRPFLVVPRLGRGLAGVVSRRPGLRAEEIMRVCFEAASLLAILADAGIRVADADLRRFELSDTGRLWYVAPQALSAAHESALQADHGRLASQFCLALSELPHPFLLPSELRAMLQRTGTAGEVASVLSVYCE